jgi:predicted ester cyclase
MSQQDRNRDLVVEGYRQFEEGKPDLERVSPALKAYVGGQTLGREQWLGFGQMFMSAFPDGRHHFDVAEGAGDWVVLHGHFTGTHKAEFMGIPATGRAVKFSFSMLDKVIDGKLVEHRGDLDSASLMQQLTTPEIDPRGVVERMLAFVDAQDWDEVRALVSPSCKVQVGAFRGGRDEWQWLGEQFYAGFPDGKHHIEDAIVSSDRVCLLGTWTGTHRGTFQGVPATGKKVAFSWTMTYRVADGKIVENRSELDSAGLMQQLTQ